MLFHPDARLELAARMPVSDLEPGCPTSIPSPGARMLICSRLPGPWSGTRCPATTFKRVARLGFMPACPVDRLIPFERASHVDFPGEVF